ncbi:MAG: rane protein [Flaviaesturariibacter sp.]|nr:rane protein [Flaviaesturariibacter sp.]
MSTVIERNIKALLQKNEQEERSKSIEGRIADAITRFTGSMVFVYIHLLLFSAWIIYNLGWLGGKPFDPSFVVLAMFASVEAIFLSTFVLISQNRLTAQADKRADLDLQVSLLAEHEITQLIKMVTAIARKMDLPEALDPELHESKQDVKPEIVLEKIEQFKGGNKEEKS